MKVLCKSMLTMILCILLIKKLQTSEEKNDEVKETDVERYVFYS